MYNSYFQSLGCSKWQQTLPHSVLSQTTHKTNKTLSSALKGAFTKYINQWEGVRGLVRVYEWLVSSIPPCKVVRRVGRGERELEREKEEGERRRERERESKEKGKQKERNERNEESETR